MMNKKSLVSVIIIFFNAEKFIEETIESVLDQSYLNWELLLIDDGSTDSSTTIALRYAERFPKKMRYLQHEGHENRGMSATRNLGIGHAQGEYVAFLDSDDIWLPVYLERMVAILDAQPKAALVYANALKWYSWRDDPDNKKTDHLYELGIQTNCLIEPPALFNWMLTGQASAPCSCSFVIRLSLLKEVNGLENSFRGMFEDQVLYTKVFLRVPVFVADGCWAKYRKHENSCVTTARKTGRDNLARLTFLKWVESYLIEQNINNPEVWQTLRQEFWRQKPPNLDRVSNRLSRLVARAKSLLKQLVGGHRPV